MKFPILTALLGTASAVHINHHQSQRLSITARIKDQCDSVKDCDSTYAQGLLQLGADPDTDQDADNRNINGNYKTHFNKTVGQIDEENKAILNTQKKCLDFVKKNPGHKDVCDWCNKKGLLREGNEPEVIWQWNELENVWYKWYDGHWHYWGPSKDGFTTEGWTYYGGYWHHGGYAYAYVDGNWYRYEQGEWVEYGKTVPVDPKPPKTKKICRPFYKLEKEGFPVSLAEKELPRCQVGDVTYMWADDAACNFLGGKKVMQKVFKCKSGEEHVWKEVTKCVLGYDLSGSGEIPLADNPYAPKKSVDEPPKPPAPAPSPQPQNNSRSTTTVSKVTTVRSVGISTIPSPFWTAETKDGETDKGTGLQLGNDYVVLKGYNDNWVTMNTINGDHMAANSATNNAWEKFKPEHIKDNLWAFKAWNGKYLCCDSNRMQANRDNLYSWEKFQVFSSEVDGQLYLSIKSNAFDTWVTVSDKGMLNCNAAVPSMSSQFTGWGPEDL